MSVNPLEPRLSRLEGAFEQVNERLGGLDRLDAKIDDIRESLTARIDGGIARLDEKIDAKIDGLRDSLTATMNALFMELRRDQMTQFRWMIGLIVVSILLPLVAHLTR